MDSQLRRGILEACVLAVLEKGREKVMELLGKWKEIVEIYQFTVRERQERNEGIA